MTQTFHMVEDLIGQPCKQGSPGYLMTEWITDISKTDESVQNDPIWKITFQSGCFTYLKENDLHQLIDNAEVSYRRAKGFDAMEEIVIVDLGDDPRFYPSEPGGWVDWHDWE